jgi:hypothetical protein
MCCAATAATTLLSRPPERSTPTGTSLARWLDTDFSIKLRSFAANSGRFYCNPGIASERWLEYPGFRIENFARHKRPDGHAGAY